MYWCAKCKEETEHEHKRTKYKGLLYDEDPQKQEKGTNALDKLMQEYYDLDCEDVIGGGKIKTRFKYINVPKENYGLTDEEIYLLDDKHLNKMVSLKNLRPYRNLDEHGNELDPEAQKKSKPNVHKVRQLKA